MKTEDISKQVSLHDVQAGKSVRVAAVTAGKGLKNRLAALGILANSPLRVVRNDGAGQIIIQVHQSKIILGRGMTHKIFVTEA